MTHPIYSKSILDTFSLPQLKEIATTLGTAPVVDKRCKANWIVCILRKQGNLTKTDFVTQGGVSLVQQPSPVSESEWEPVIKSEILPETEQEFDKRCLEQSLVAIGSQSLTQLKAYCDRYFIDQSSWFEILKGVFNQVFCGICGTAKSHQDSVIVDAIRDAESESERCCDLLEIELIDLEIACGNVVIPAGIPSIKIYRSGKLVGVLTKHPTHGTYHAHKCAVGYDDSYSAALGFVHPDRVETVREQIKRDRQSAVSISDYF